MGFAIFIIIFISIIVIIIESNKSIKMIDKLEQLGKMKKEEAVYYRANVLNNNIRQQIKIMYKRDIEMNTDDATSDFIDSLNKAKNDSTFKTSKDVFTSEDDVNPIKEKGKNRCKKI